MTNPEHEERKLLKKAFFIDDEFDYPAQCEGCPRITNYILKISDCRRQIKKLQEAAFSQFDGIDTEFIAKGLNSEGESPNVNEAGVNDGPERSRNLAEVVTEDTAKLELEIALFKFKAEEYAADCPGEPSIAYSFGALPVTASICRKDVDRAQKQNKGQEIPVTATIFIDEEIDKN